MIKRISYAEIEAQHKRIMAKRYICSENGKECKIIDLSQCTATAPWCDIEFLDGTGNYTIQIDKLKEIK